MNKIDKTLKGKKNKKMLHEPKEQKKSKSQTKNKHWSKSKVKKKEENKKKEHDRALIGMREKKYWSELENKTRNQGGKKIEIRNQGSTLLHRNENEGHKDIAK